MKTLKLIIFDMDGLIFDTERIFMETKMRVAGKYGYKITPSDYLRTVGCSGRILRDKLTKQYGEDYPAETISRETRLLMESELSGKAPPIKPGIRKLLETVRGLGLRCCVASSTPGYAVRDYLSRAGLDEYFEFCVAGDMVSKSKPDPEIYIKVCRRGGVEPAEALALEDSENGVLSAAAAGVSVICIPDLARPSENVMEKALFVADSAIDVTKYLSMTVRN